MSEGFKARDIGLRAQKKILGRMAANKNTRKMFIDDNTASLLDNLYRMIRLYVSSKLSVIMTLLFCIDSKSILRFIKHFSEIINFTEIIDT